MALRGFLGFLLVLAIGLTMSSYVFFNMTEHDKGQQFLSKSISDSISQQAKQEDFLAAEKNVNFSCKETGTAYLNITNSRLKMNCSDVGKLPFKTMVANAIYNDIYYKSYGCGFFNCFTSTENFPALMAQQTHQKYWIYYLYLLCADVILAIILFAVSSGWHRKANVFGYVFLISGIGALPFYVTEKIFGTMADFMNKVFYVQIALFVLGVVLLIWGAALKSKHNKRMKEAGEDYEES